MKRPVFVVLVGIVRGSQRASQGTDMNRRFGAQSMDLETNLVTLFCCQSQEENIFDGSIHFIKYVF